MTPLFTLPPQGETPTRPEETRQFLQKLREEAEKVHQPAIAVGDTTEREMTQQNLNVEFTVLKITLGQFGISGVGD